MRIRPIVIEEAPPIMPHSTATPQELARFPISPALSASLSAEGGPDEEDELDEEEEWDDDDLDDDDDDDDEDEIENWDEDEDEEESQS